MLTVPNEIFNSMTIKEIYESSNIEKLTQDELISEVENEIICLKIYENLTFKQIGARLGFPTDKTGILFKKALEILKKSLILSEEYLPKIIELDKENGIINLNKRKLSLKNRLNSYLKEKNIKPNDKYHEYLLNEIGLINKQMEIISELESTDTLRLFDFTSRTANSLYRNSIVSIKQLKLLINTDELKNVRNLGQRGIDEINDNLKRLSY